MAARPLRDDAGETKGGVIVLRDVTAQKRAAEALEAAKQDAESANHAKSEFLSRMSHELRTPLNSILGFAQLLELGHLSEQEADNVYHILKGGYHLLDLINEILDLARIESGRITLSSEPVGVKDALKDAIDLVGPLAIEKRVNLNSEVALCCDHYVHADRQRLKQVLLNLLSNAIKFNRTGGVVSIACRENVPAKLRIEVTDTGPGISAQGLKRIFTPFERLDADTRDAGGTGLGLALSKRLIEAMGGTIGVESAVGFGSKFFIELSMIDDPIEILKAEPGCAGLAGGLQRPVPRDRALCRRQPVESAADRTDFCPSAGRPPAFGDGWQSRPGPGGAACSGLDPARPSSSGYFRRGDPAPFAGQPQDATHSRHDSQRRCHGGTDLPAAGCLAYAIT